MAEDDNKLSLNTDSSLLFMARIHNNKQYFFLVETINLLVLTQNQFPIKKKLRTNPSQTTTKSASTTSSAVANV